MRAFFHTLACLLVATATAAPPPIALREVASGLSIPTEIANAGDGSGRLFILEQGGRIRILKGGVLLPRDFLDIGGLTVASGERGAIGLAFHPRYAENRRFFVSFTRRSDGAVRVSSFTAFADDPDRADLSSEREVITIAHADFANHNGGHIAFGPEGYLYVGVGDGGSGGDPFNNAQNRNVLLGKLLRLDVDVESGYRIPPDNPFAGVAGTRGEIWAYGLRNPWKFSFDRATDDLYIGDVGQGLVEEVDFVPDGTPGGLNFGWRVFEGLRCFDTPSGCVLQNHFSPVLQYDHNTAGGISITGGYVYRGVKSAALNGYYFYGDFGSNRVWAARREGTAWVTTVVVSPGGELAGISTFGEDEVGELYVASYTTGRIFAIEGPGPALNPAGRFMSGGERCRFDAPAETPGNRAERGAQDCRAWRVPP